MFFQQLPVIPYDAPNGTQLSPDDSSSAQSCPSFYAPPLDNSTKNPSCILFIVLCFTIQVSALTANPNITEGVSVQLEISYTSLSYYVQAIFTLTVVVTLPLFAIYSLVKSWSYLKAKIGAILPYLGIASLLMGWRSFISTINNNGVEEQQNEEDGISMET